MKLVKYWKGVTVTTRGVETKKFKRMFGLKTGDLAWLLGISKGTISGWEKGRLAVKAKYLVLLYELSRKEVAGYLVECNPNEEIIKKLYPADEYRRDVYRRWDLLKRMVNKNGTSAFPRVIKFGL